MLKNKTPKKGVFLKDAPRYILWQVLIWDKFAKASPFILMIIFAIFYLLGIRDYDLLFDSLGVMLCIVMIIWWFWILYTISTIAYIIDRSSNGLKGILREIKEIREEIIHLSKNRKP